MQAEAITSSTCSSSGQHLQRWLRRRCQRWLEQRLGRRFQGQFRRFDPGGSCERGSCRGRSLALSRPIRSSIGFANTPLFWHCFLQHNGQDAVLQRGFVFTGFEAALRLIPAEFLHPDSLRLPDGLNLSNRTFFDGRFLVDHHLHAVGNVVRDDVDFILADAGTLDANKAMQAFAIFKLFVVYVHKGLKAGVVRDDLPQRRDDAAGFGGHSRSLGRHVHVEGTRTTIVAFCQLLKGHGNGLLRNR
mmetsp:Transcript_326/g.651  ORF Transcript_326/g.651 Transcript_326/m.651 type:complete len:245 (+) Transcript_326:163-897(+)